MHEDRVNREARYLCRHSAETGALTVERAIERPAAGPSAAATADTSGRSFTDICASRQGDGEAEEGHRSVGCRPLIYARFRQGVSTASSRHGAVKALVGHMGEAERGERPPAERSSFSPARGHGGSAGCAASPDEVPPVRCSCREADRAHRTPASAPGAAPAMRKSSTQPPARTPVWQEQYTLRRGKRQGKPALLRARCPFVPFVTHEGQVSANKGVAMASTPCSPGARCRAMAHAERNGSRGNR